MVPLHRVIVFIGLGVLFVCDSTLSVAPTQFYTNQSLREWCDSNPVLKAVRRIISQPTKLRVSRDNSLELYHRWDSSFNNECQFLVTADRGMGLILNIVKINFRLEPRYKYECLDSIQIGYTNNTNPQRMCGTINATAAEMPRSYVVPDGAIEVKIRIDDVRRVLAFGETVHLHMLVTQYDPGCQLPKSFPCGENMCIPMKYVNDGKINCPYPSCTDESLCHNKTLGEPAPTTSKRAIIGGIAVAVMLGVIMPIMLCCCWEFCRKDLNPHYNPGGNVLTEISEIENITGGRRRHRPRSHPRTNRRRGDGTETATSGIDPSSPTPLTDEQKESPPPTYESLFPPQQ